MKKAIKRLKRCLFFVPSFLAVAGFTIPAFAQDPTYSGAYIYKDASNNIFFATAPSSIGGHLKVSIAGITIDTTKNADACGVMKWKFPTSSGTPPTTIKIDGTTQDLSTPTATTKADWMCNSSTGALTAGTSGMMPSSTTPVIKDSNGTYYIFKSANTAYLVEFTGSVTKSIKINKCQFGELKFSAKQKIDPATASVTPEIAGATTSTTTTVASMPMAPGTPKCSSKTGTITLPNGWTY